MTFHRLLALFAIVILACTFSTGCSKPYEQKADPEALKKELEDLNKARKQEWKQ